MLQFTEDPAPKLLEEWGIYFLLIKGIKLD